MSIPQTCSNSPPKWKPVPKLGQKPIPGHQQKRKSVQIPFCQSEVLLILGFVLFFILLLEE